jgi:SAM-dependent methyltransferase
MSMMLHHLMDRPRAAKECRRLLRDGGRLCVRNSTRDSLYPQRRFFPGIGAMIERDLPSRDDVIALFEGAGLRLCTYRRIAQPVAENWAGFAEKLALRADSFLARLPDSEFERGMDALRAHAARDHAQGPIMEDIHWLVFD